jgi:hypothetical protein
MSLRLIRVFPRKTRATLGDALAYFGPPDRLDLPSRVLYWAGGFLEIQGPWRGVRGGAGSA